MSHVWYLIPSYVSDLKLGKGPSVLVGLRHLKYDISTIVDTLVQNDSIHLYASQHHSGDQGEPISQRYNYHGLNAVVR